MFLHWLFYVLLVKTVSGLYGSQYAFASESAGSPIVSTTSGQFSGLTIQQTNIWIGIPYAAPPVGTLRWQKAQPYVMNSSQNSTIQDATHYGASCPQLSQDGSVPGPFDEDCLYLNVWAPIKPSSKSAGYPVMLWIHGGAFISGSASIVLYDGLTWTNAAINNNNSFIMVSINYRLNVMGFFAQPSLLDGNGNTIANQGLTDQRMAMQWIQNNIAQFGGDKNSVTIMGQSAGSHSVCFHIVSPLSSGLFRAGILDSGTCDTVGFLRNTSYAYSMANDLALLVGCNITNSTQQLACLQAVNSTSLVAATANIIAPPSTLLAFKGQEQVGGFFPFTVIVDGIELPIHPLQAFLMGRVNQVPILIGANHDEFLLRALYQGYYDPPTSAQDYLTRILPILTYNNSDLQALYAPSQFNGNYTQADVALLSQGFFICSARRMAGYMNVQSTYLYTYTHTPELVWLREPSLVIWPGAYHTAELFNLFQTLTNTLYGNSVFLSDELSLATSMQQYWTNMITNSQPNNNISLIWPQYSSTNDQTIVLNKNITIASFINIYPNCDLFSAVEVQVFSEYLGFNATCTVGNICFIINSTTSTNATTNVNPITTTMSTTTITSTSTSNNLCYSLFNLLFLLFSCIIFLF